MDLRVPMILFFAAAPCGQILSYGYETPWAMGTFAAADPAQGQQWIAVCECLEQLESEPETSETESEQSWQAALAARGLTDADTDRYSAGPWLIQTQDGLQHQLHAPPVFDRQGFVTWRW